MAKREDNQCSGGGQSTTVQLKVEGGDNVEGGEDAGGGEDVAIKDAHHDQGAQQENHVKPGTLDVNSTPEQQVILTSSQEQFKVVPSAADLSQPDMTMPHEAVKAEPSIESSLSNLTLNTPEEKVKVVPSAADLSQPDLTLPHEAVKAEPSIELSLSNLTLNTPEEKVVPSAADLSQPDLTLPHEAVKAEPSIELSLSNLTLNTPEEKVVPSAADLSQSDLTLTHEAIKAEPSIELSSSNLTLNTPEEKFKVVSSAADLSQPDLTLPHEATKAEPSIELSLSNLTLNTPEEKVKVVPSAADLSQPDMTLLSSQGQKVTSSNTPSLTCSDGKDIPSTSLGELTTETTPQGLVSVTLSNVTSKPLQGQSNPPNSKKTTKRQDKDKQSNDLSNLTLTPTQGQVTPSKATLNTSGEQIKDIPSSTDNKKPLKKVKPSDCQISPSNRPPGLTLKPSKDQIFPSNKLPGITLKSPQVQASLSKCPPGLTLKSSQGQKSPSNIPPGTTVNQPIKVFPESTDIAMPLKDLVNITFQVTNQESTRMQLGILQVDGVEIIAVETHPQELSLCQISRGIYRILQPGESYKSRLTLRLDPQVWETKQLVKFPIMLSLKADIRLSRRGNSVFFTPQYKDPQMYPMENEENELTLTYRDSFEDDYALAKFEDNINSVIQKFGVNNKATIMEKRKFISYLLESGRNEMALNIVTAMYNQYMGEKESMDITGFTILTDRIKCLERLGLYSEAWNDHLKELDYIKVTRGDMVAYLKPLCKIAFKLLDKGQFEFMQFFLTLCKDVLSDMNNFRVLTTLLHLHAIISLLEENYCQNVAIDLYDDLYDTICKSRGESDSIALQVLLNKAIFMETKFISLQEVYAIYCHVYQTQVKYQIDTFDTLVIMCKTAVRTFTLYPEDLIMSKWMQLMKQKIANPNTDKDKLITLLRKVAEIIYTCKGATLNLPNYDQLLHFAYTTHGYCHYITLEILLNKGDMLAMYPSTWNSVDGDKVVEIYYLVHKFATAKFGEGSLYAGIAQKRKESFLIQLEKKWENLLTKHNEDVKNDMFNLVLNQNMARIAAVLHRYDKPDIWKTFLTIFDRKPKTKPEIYCQLSIMSNIAKDLMTKSKNDFAIQVYERMMTKMILAYGNADVKTLMAKRDVAECLLTVNRVDEAYSMILDICKGGKYKLPEKPDPDENVKKVVQNLLKILPGMAAKPYSY